MNEPHYWLQLPGLLEREVSKEDWVWAERLAGFHNTMGKPSEPATAAFSAKGIRGWIEYPNSLEMDYP